MVCAVWVEEKTYPRATLANHDSLWAHVCWRGSIAYSIKCVTLPCLYVLYRLMSLCNGTKSYLLSKLFFFYHKAVIGTDDQGWVLSVSSAGQDICSECQQIHYIAKCLWTPDHHAYKWFFPKQSTQLCRMYMLDVALQFSFTGIKRLKHV